MAERTASISIEFTSDMSKVREDLAKLREELASNPFEAAIKAQNARMMGAPISTFGSEAGTPYTGDGPQGLTPRGPGSGLDVQQIRQQARAIQMILGAGGAVGPNVEQNLGGFSGRAPGTSPNRIYSGDTSEFFRTARQIEPSPGGTVAMMRLGPAQPAASIDFPKTPIVPPAVVLPSSLASPKSNFPSEALGTIKPGTAAALPTAIDIAFRRAQSVAWENFQATLADQSLPAEERRTRSQFWGRMFDTMEGGSIERREADPRVEGGYRKFRVANPSQPPQWPAEFAGGKVLPVAGDTRVMPVPQPIALDATDFARKFSEAIKVPEIQVAALPSGVEARTAGDAAKAPPRASSPLDAIPLTAAAAIRSPRLEAMQARAQPIVLPPAAPVRDEAIRSIDSAVADEHRGARRPEVLAQLHAIRARQQASPRLVPELGGEPEPANPAARVLTSPSAASAARRPPVTIGGLSIPPGGPGGPFPGAGPSSGPIAVVARRTSGGPQPTLNDPRTSAWSMLTRDRFGVAAGGYAAITTATDLLGTANAYSTDLALAGNDPAAQLRAQIAHRDRMASVVPVVGALGSEIREAITGERRQAVFDLDQIELRERGGRALLSGRTASRAATLDASVAEAGLGGDFAGRRVALSAQLEQNLVSNALSYLDRAAPIIERKGKLDTEIATQKASLEARGVEFKPDGLPFSTRGRSAVSDEELIAFSKLQKEAASAAESLGKLDVSSKGQREAYERQNKAQVELLNFQAEMATRSLTGDTAASALASRGLGYQAGLETIDAQIDNAKAELAKAKDSGDATQVNLAQAKLDASAGQRDRYVKANAVGTAAQVVRIEGQTEGTRLARTGSTLQGELTRIESDRVATILQMDQAGGAEYLKNPASAALNDDQRQLFRSIEASYAEQRAQANLKGAQATIATAGFVRGAALRTTGRDPLGAQFNAIDTQFDIETKDMTAGTKDYKEAQDRRNAAKGEAAYYSKFDRTQTRIGLVGEAQALTRALSLDNVGAGAFSTAASYQQQVLQLQQGGDAAGAELARKNGTGQLDLQRKTYLMGFRAEQFDFYNRMPFTARDAQNPEEVMNAFSEASAQLKGANLDSEGGAGALKLDDATLNAMGAKTEAAVANAMRGLLDQ